MTPLGFRLQVATLPHSSAVRLVPQSARARIACKRQGGEMIEATCAVGHDDERIDATREAVRAALDLAKDAGA